MNSKQRKTLEAIFSRPTKTDIPFADIEQLLIALGAELTEGAGSRVKFTLDDTDWSAHRPHPNKQALRYQLKELREFLLRLGIQP